MSSSENKEVLIVGTYSGLNKGDRLMQQVTIDIIKDLGATPILASPFPEIDKDIYTDIKVIRARRRNLPLSLVQCLLLYISPKKAKLFYASHNKELSHFLCAQLIIDTSGDMLTEDYGPHIALSHLFPLIYSVLLNKKLLILGQSIGPFNIFKKIFIHIFRYAEYVNVRDEITYRYLEPYNISGLKQVADLGFLLNEKVTDDNSITDTIHFGGRTVIGICPSALFFNKFTANKSTVSLQHFCTMLNTAAQRHNLAFVIIPHVSTPNGLNDDAKLAIDIKHLITHPCLVADNQLEPAELKFLIARFSAMITFRMHGAIAALDTYTPTIAISYSHKTNGLFKMLQLDNWVVDNNSALIDTISEKLTSLLTERENIRRHLERVIPDIRKQAEINIHTIKKALS